MKCGESMNLRMIKNDLKRNKTGNAAFLLFMFLATALISVSVFIVSNLFNSINGMYRKAQPPHFAQLHLGEVSKEEVADFMSEYEDVTKWQLQTQINMYCNDIELITDTQTRSMEDCRLDVSIVRQNADFDYLLDDNGNVAKMPVGEIGFPVILLDQYDVKLGDHVRMTLGGITKEFVISTFIHDGAMNSTFCSSTRFLVNEKDFEDFHQNADTIETLVEVQLTDTAEASAFQTAYENAGMPQEGQAITYSGIFLLSTMTDMMLAFVLVLAGLILVWIASFCVKYTIMATLEEEVSEIGTMKAIGLDHRAIKQLYLLKYRMLLATGTVGGYLFTLGVSGKFSAHIIRTFGKQPVSLGVYLMPILSCILVFAITVWYCKKILDRMKHLTIVDALVTGEGFDKHKKQIKSELVKSKHLPIDLKLSISDVKNHFKAYILIFGVVLLATIIIEIPYNLACTFESEKAMPYFGRAMTDIVIDFQSGKEDDEKLQKVLTLLEKDPAISRISTFEGVRMAIQNGNENYNLHVECGKGAGDGLYYLSGRMPKTEDEMALSYSNSKVLEKKVGDKITTSDGKLQYRICGIYQDITSGGLTAKAIVRPEGAKTESYMMGVETVEGTDLAAKAESYRSVLGFGYEIEAVREFVSQTFGGVSGTLYMAAKLIGAFGIMIIILVIILFMKLRLVKDVAEIASLKAVGFSSYDIRKQYVYKIGSLALLGVIIGAATFKTIGGVIVSTALNIAGIGIAQIVLMGNAWNNYVVIPAMIMIIVSLMTWGCTRTVENYHIASLINE